MDGYDKPLGNVEIKLHDIVTGPPEQDFPVNMNKVRNENNEISMYKGRKRCSETELPSENVPDDSHVN